MAVGRGAIRNTNKSLALHRHTYLNDALSYADIFIGTRIQIMRCLMKKEIWDLTILTPGAAFVFLTTTIKPPSPSLASSNTSIKFKIICVKILQKKKRELISQ